MQNGLIVYSSKYGSAKKYAEWLSEDTGYACRDISEVRAADIKGMLIFCGAIYASGISGLPRLKKLISAHEGKAAVLCVGASPFDAEAFEKLKERNMSGKLTDIPVFYARGAWDESKMSFTDRTMCKLLIKSLQKQDPNTYEPWMKALAEAAGKKCDWTDRKYLTPLLDALGKQAE